MEAQKSRMKVSKSFWERMGFQHSAFKQIMQCHVRIWHWRNFAWKLIPRWEEPICSLAVIQSQGLFLQHQKILGLDFAIVICAASFQYARYFLALQQSPNIEGYLVTYYFFAFFTYQFTCFQGFWDLGEHCYDQLTYPFDWNSALYFKTFDVHGKQISVDFSKLMFFLY